MIVFAHPDHRLHDPREPHRFGGQLLPPNETASRADRILGVIEGDDRFDIRRPDDIKETDLRLVHEERYLKFLRTAHERWRESSGSPEDGEAVAYIRPLPGTSYRTPTFIDAELGVYSNDVDPILAGTYPAALSAAACALAAARAVFAGEPAAYALTRPPGHHAAPAVFGGYCYLNNLAIAAAWLAAAGAQVGVIDIDGHHGNGTQTVFWARGDVITTSIHGDPDRHFPFYMGHADETGEGPGSGANLNLPLPTGSSWSRYRPALEQAVSKVADVDVLIVALGVDTHEDDGVLGLSSADYPAVGATLRQAGLPTILVQEGGYSPGVLESAVPAVLSAFLP